MTIITKFFTISIIAVLAFMSSYALATEELLYPQVQGPWLYSSPCTEGTRDSPEELYDELSKMLQEENARACLWVAEPGNWLRSSFTNNVCTISNGVTGAGTGAGDSLAEDDGNQQAVTFKRGDNCNSDFLRIVKIERHREEHCLAGDDYQSDLNGCISTPDPEEERPESARPTNCRVNPIDIDTGNKFQREADYISATPYAPSLTRYYNSVDYVAPTVLGPRWRHTYNKSIALDESGQVATVFVAEGQRDYFFLLGIGSEKRWSSQQRANYALQEIRENDIRIASVFPFLVYPGTNLLTRAPIKLARDLPVIIAF